MSELESVSLPDMQSSEKKTEKGEALRSVDSLDSAIVSLAQRMLRLTNRALLVHADAPLANASTPRRILEMALSLLSGTHIEVVTVIFLLWRCLLCSRACE
jgi:hypothetical protein